MTVRSLLSDLAFGLLTESAGHFANRLGFELVRSSHMREMHQDLVEASDDIHRKTLALNGVRPLLKDLKWGRAPEKVFVELATRCVFGALDLALDADDGAVVKFDGDGRVKA